jgi:hypothetical protein
MSNERRDVHRAQNLQCVDFRDRGYYYKPVRLITLDFVTWIRTSKF